MKTIHYNISTETEIQLYSLIGKRIQLIYSDGIVVTYGENALESKNLFFSLKNGGYLWLSTKWFECDATLEDFYEFRTEIVDALSPSQKTSLFSFFDTSEIKSVSIVRKNFPVNDIIVEYDFAILLERNDLKKVLITGGESALRNLVICHDRKSIDELLIQANVTLVKIRATG